MNDVTRGVPPVIAGYRYVSDLGRGGFADVYRYEQEALGRDVAVKVLCELGDAARARMRAEARVMARLSNHPHVVPLYEVGEASDGRPYLVLELCDPPDLAGRLARHTCNLEETLAMGVQLAGAVATAHDLGILHLDLKPSNVLITAYGRPAITDFGIAQTLWDESDVRACSPAWAAPEQLQGQRTPAADVFGLAATLWACLTGAPPPRPSSVPDATQPRLPALAAPLEGLLSRCLDADPAGRPSAADLGRALQRLQAQRALALTPLDLAVAPVPEPAPAALAVAEHPTRYWPPLEPAAPAVAPWTPPAWAPAAPVAPVTPVATTGPATPTHLAAASGPGASLARRPRRGALAAVAGLAVVLVLLAAAALLLRPQTGPVPNPPAPPSTLTPTASRAPTSSASSASSASAGPAAPPPPATPPPSGEIELNPGGATFGSKP